MLNPIGRLFALVNAVVGAIVRPFRPGAGSSDPIVQVGGAHSPAGRILAVLKDGDRRPLATVIADSGLDEASARDAIQVLKNERLIVQVRVVADGSHMLKLTPTGRDVMGITSIQPINNNPPSHLV